MSKTAGPVLVVAAVCALQTVASAQEAQRLLLASLAAACATCHGTQGKAVDAGALPSLAGMPADALLAQMKAFKSGARPSTIMQQLSKGYTDAQLEQLAAYFAAQGK